MTVYIDVVLLENLCMNYIILFGTAYITKIKRKHVRIFFSSLVGAIYAILAYAGIFPIYANLVVKIILSICMVYIAFSPKTIKGMLKELVVFYLVSFLLGGCAFALLYMVKPQNILMKDGVLIGTYPIKIALLGGVVGFTITYIAFRVVKKKMTQKELIYSIKIVLGNKQLETLVMLDTGNMLKDPISQYPVILIEKEKMSELLPKSLLENTEKILGGEWREENEEKEKYRTRLRIIPFTSVGKRNGMMLGIKVDNVIVKNDEEEIENKNAIVCIYENKFSKSGKYFGLISIDLLEGSENIEHFTTVKR